MGNFCLEEFVKSYVDSAVETINFREIISLENFDSIVSKEVPNKTDLSLRKIKYLHHAFHWALFIDKPPVFKLADNERYKPGYQIRKNGNLSDKEQLCKNVIDKYGAFLNSRINSEEWRSL